MTTIDKQQRKKETASIHINMEIKNQLLTIARTFQSNSKLTQYFYDRFSDYYNKDNRSLSEKKVIATTCLYVPDELIYAIDAIPLRVCNGSFSLDQIGGEFMPSKSCPMAKSSLGMFHLNEYPMGAKPELIIVPTSCDQKKKLPEMLPNHEIEIYPLEVPPGKESEASLLFWYRSISKLVEKLEKISGKKITKRKLGEAIQKIALAQQEFHKLNLFRKGPPVIWGTDVIAIANTLFFDDIQSWTNAVKNLNLKLNEKIKAKDFLLDNTAPRILLTGSPSVFPNLKVPVMIEQSGAIIVSDEFCSSNRFLYDPVAVDEWNVYDMIPAIADRYLKPCTCPNLSPNNDRVRKLLEAIKGNKVDGVIYQAFSGCHLYEIESIKLARIMEQHDIPMLYLETDYSPDDEGQLSTRIEAFLEALKTKKIQTKKYV